MLPRKEVCFKKKNKKIRGLLLFLLFWGISFVYVFVGSICMHAFPCVCIPICMCVCDVHVCNVLWGEERVLKKAIVAFCLEAGTPYTFQDKAHL